jgi:hypothetical protein
MFVCRNKYVIKIFTIPMATVPTSNVTTTAIKKADWTAGYDGEFVIENTNDYDILLWTLTFTLPRGEKFTWFSDGDLVTTGDTVTLTPKDYNNVIKAGTTKILGFGGVKTLPGKITFNQVLPLVGDDSSLTTRGKWSDKIIAPYVDACAWPIPDLVKMSKDSGLTFFTLAFITADANNRASWSGTIPLESQHMLAKIRDIRSAGGDVSVSFGGANGQEIAQVIKDVDVLVAEYSRVIDMYSLTRIDFDIEGGAVSEDASVDRRNKAITALKKKYPHIQVTYCLPVLPVGLTLDGERLVRNAKKRGADIESFHGMSMDFGDSAAPDPEGRMAAYVISSAENMRKQVLSAGYARPKIGLIPMIGVNDVESEIFRVRDAARVRDFFRSTPWMSYVGWWSVNRDQPGAGKGANPANSGLRQAPYDFAKIFLGGDVDEMDPSPCPSPPPIKIPGSTIPPNVIPEEGSSSNAAATNYDDIRVDGKITHVIGNKCKISYKKPDGRKGSATVAGCGNVGDKVIVFLKHDTFKFSNIRSVLIS